MATLTITTTAAHDARIIAAFGARLNLGRDATVAEVKAQVIGYVINAVQEYEQRVATAAAAAGVTLITPT